MSVIGEPEYFSVLTDDLSDATGGWCPLQKSAATVVTDGAVSAEPEWKRCEHHWVWHSGPMIEQGVSVTQCSECDHLRADASHLVETLAVERAKVARVEAVLKEHWDWKAGRSLHAAVAIALRDREEANDGNP